MLILLFVVAGVPPVPMVHEQVQQRTQEQQRVRQDTENVGSVLGYEEESGDGEEGEQHHPRPRPKEGAHPTPPPVAAKRSASR